MAITIPVELNKKIDRGQVEKLEEIRERLLRQGVTVSSGYRLQPALGGSVTPQPRRPHTSANSQPPRNG